MTPEKKQHAHKNMRAAYHYIQSRLAEEKVDSLDR
jgi:hypothetical protein